MNPDSLARHNTESGHQKALFAWANMARIWGFVAANDPDSYTMTADREWKGQDTVPPLKWLHSIPNGGLRDAATASRMKAEGVRKGVADVFLPAVIPKLQWSGLYIELKKTGKNKIDDDQKEFAAFVKAQGYKHVFVEGWRAAADAIENYLQGIEPAST